MRKQQYFIAIFFCIVLGLICSSCAKDDYYIDGGRAQAEFSGTIMDYLDSKPVEFDSIAEIIRLAGLEGKFKNEEFTFFSPRDENIKALIGTVDKGGINRNLYFRGLDTIKKLADIDGHIWEKFLMRHIFNGKNKLEDYIQIDFSLQNIYSGQNYISQAGTVCNIGVVFNDAVGGGSTLKYMGYRQLHISYIRNTADPNNFRSYPVSSSDIQPYNGVVHVIDHTKGEFGFDYNEVYNDILESKR